jgi:hypothetical protein
MGLLKAPTVNQRILARHYLKTGNKKEAALKAYDVKPEYALKMANNVLSNPMVQTYMKKVLDEEGLSDSLIGRKFRKIIEAGTTPGALKAATVGNALTALQEVSRLKDLYPATKTQIDQRTARLNLNLVGKSEEELMAMLDEVQGEIKDFRKVIETTKQLAKPVELPV